MRYVLARFLFLSILTLGFVACALQTEPPGKPNEEVAVVEQSLYQDITSYDLVMGNTNIVVGTVYVATDDTCGTIYVKVLVNAGYNLDETHACLSQEAFPWTAPGQCQYQSGTLPDGTKYYFFPPISVMDVFGIDALEGDGHFYLQVHATVSYAESGEHAGSAYAGHFKGQISYAFSCDVPPPEEEYGCTYTQGYWKNHPEAWPVDSLVIGGQTYTKTQLLRILKTAPRGDASLIMGHQLIAAMLNLASGSGGPASLMDAYDEAQQWMTDNADGDGRLPYGLTAKVNKQEFEEGVSLGATLDNFNNGDYGPPHCDSDGAPESIPE